MKSTAIAEHWPLKWLSDQKAQSAGWGWRGKVALHRHVGHGIEGCGGDQALAEFVSSLFGESFSQEDVIGETLITKPPPSRTYIPPFTRIAPQEIQAFDHEDDTKLAALAERSPVKS